MILKENKILTLIIINLLIFSQITIVSEEYSYNFTPDQVGFQVELTMKLNDVREFNVSITNENVSLTAIIQVLDGSGPLWGFFLVNSSYYYSIKNNGTDVHSALQKCCQKYADHAWDYTLLHIFINPGSYVLRFDNIHGHPSTDSHFIATFLKGQFGTETNILPPVSPSTVLNLFIIPISLIVIGAPLVIIILKKRNGRKSKKINEDDQISSSK